LSARRWPAATEEISCVDVSSPPAIPSLDTSAAGIWLQVERIGMPAIFEPSSHVFGLFEPFPSNVESRTAPLDNLVS
jgi:hypothetical protein